MKLARHSVKTGIKKIDPQLEVDLHANNEREQHCAIFINREVGR